MYWPDSTCEETNGGELLRIVVCNDLESAALFQRYFPEWRVRCILMLPPSQSERGARPGQRIELAHPISGVSAVADVMGAWQKNGRLLGLVLQFADGYRVGLTFEEIQALQGGEGAG